MGHGNSCARSMFPRNEARLIIKHQRKAMGPLEPIDKSGAIRNIFSYGKKCVKPNAVKARWKIMGIIIIIITYPSKEIGFQKLNHKYVNSNYIFFCFFVFFFEKHVFQGRLNVSWNFFNLSLRCFVNVSYKFWFAPSPKNGYLQCAQLCLLFFFVVFFLSNFK